MKIWLAMILSMELWGMAGELPELPPTSAQKVFILPIREEIMPPLVYLVRRGVKEAMEAHAGLLIVNMDTPGGRVDTCREIISILKQFGGDTVTYVNKDAFSAGAFIAVATKHIYMAPESVIGAAAPIMLAPGGEGPMSVPDTAERKINSAVRALVRAAAETNGYNLALVQAMIDKTRGFSFTNVVDGVTNVVSLAKEGEILTLTNTEAEREYGQPPKKLLSSGTVPSLEELIKQLGYAAAERHNIKTTGAEKIGFWLNTISPLLLIIAIVGFYIEFKTPGVALPGVIAVLAALLYFLGGYVAGLSGMEWVLVFIVGVVLVALELFVFTGTVALGITGAVLIFVSLVMALVDKYPGMPPIPTLPQLTLPLRQLAIAVLGAGVCIAILGRFLPATPFYKMLVSESASGVLTEARQHKQRASLEGQMGVTISILRPGGKAQFGNQVVDVISQGDLVPKGTPVRIIGFSGTEALVEVVKESSVT